MAHGYEALVLTVDLARIGRRERDLRIGFRIPEEVEIPNVAIAAGVTPEEVASVAFVDRMSWPDVEWLAGFGLPVIIKGILHPDDARRALEAGMDGIVVSNHGGRQVDGAIATLDALPGVVDAVDGRAPVLLDSGVRSGADAFKALALGATAVLVGRAYVWGLAVAGQAGVREVLENLRAELDLTMALAGCASLDEVGPGTLQDVG